MPASCQRDHGVWESTETPSVCVQVTHYPGKGPGLIGDAAMAHPLPGSPCLMLSLKTEGGEGRTTNEGGGKTVWVHAFPILFRLVPPFAS